MNKYFGFFLLLCICGLPGCWNAEEKAAIAKLKPTKDPILEEIYGFRLKMRALYNSRRFSELEPVAAEIRRTKPRFDNGSWKIAQFYESFACRREEPESMWQLHDRIHQDWIERTWRRPRSPAPDNHPRDAIDRIGETLQQVHNGSLSPLDSLGKRTIQAFRDHELEVQAIATARRERLTMRQALERFLAANTTEDMRRDTCGATDLWRLCFEDREYVPTQFHEADPDCGGRSELVRAPGSGARDGGCVFKRCDGKR